MESRANVRGRLSGGPFALGLFGSVAVVLALLRQPVVQRLAAEMFGTSQSAVSRWWDALWRIIEAEFVLTPAGIAVDQHRAG